MTYFNYNGKNIAYQIDCGENDKPLVLLNGIMMNMNSWTPFMSNFLKHRKVIRIDLLDQGASEKMDTAYTLDDQAKAVIALLDYLNIDKYDLFGISYGAHTALTISTLDVERVDKLLVYNCLPDTNKLLRDIGTSWKVAAQKNDPELFFLNTIPIIYSIKFYEDNSAWMDARKPVLLKVFDETYLQSMIRLVTSSETYDVREKLSNIKANTLVVGCSDDLLTPAKYTKKVAENITNSKYIELPDCGHASMYEKPNEFLATLCGFLVHDNVKIV